MQVTTKLNLPTVQNLKSVWNSVISNWISTLVDHWHLESFTGFLLTAPVIMHELYTEHPSTFLTMR